MVFHNESCVKCGELYTDTTYEWCKPCELKDLKKNVTSWTSGDEKIDNFIQDMQLKRKTPSDNIIEWIPYSQFNNIEEIDKDRFFTAKWKDGPLYWNKDNGKYIRKLGTRVALKCLQNTNTIPDEV
jgi:hypothetical protein